MRPQDEVIELTEEGERQLDEIMTRPGRRIPALAELFVGDRRLRSAVSCAAGFFVFLAALGWVCVP